GIGTAAPENKLGINTPVASDASAQALIYTGGVSNKGLVIQRAASQTANLFEIQNESGQTLTFFNSDGELGLGRSTSFDGALIFNNATNSNTLRLVTGTATSNQTITLPDESGTVCIQDSNNCGFIKMAESSAQTDTSTDTSLFINKTGVSGDILRLQKNGSDVFTIANGGAVQIRSDSATALQIMNSAGTTSFFTVDTSSGTIQVGSATGDATGILFVLDNKNTSGDPTGVAGAQYYNSFTDKFRCYEEGQWKNCIGNTAVRSFIDTVSNAVQDNNTTDYWDTGAENNNSYANIALTQASGRSVMGTVTMETNSTSTADRETTARVERGIGSPPTCGSGTPVGGQPGTFSSNNGSQKASTITFIDDPGTTSNVYYTLCADTATAGTTGASITRIRITLQEVINSN
ncbi:hypothetical protein KDA00_05840, partial [Candidatus Saccharibacteria bacterium]|nr:hypothetical protein [Candidatus Saccharibacteria bacterium]